MSSNIKRISTLNFIGLTIIIYFSITLSGLFVPLVENACKYAQVSREIIDNGDWVNMTIAHEPYDQKPPLLFWLGAFFYQLLGVSIISFKIPVLLLSSVGIYATYRFAKLLYNRRVGLLAAFFWATSLGYFYFHNDIHTDSILVNFVILAIWQLTAFFRDKKWYNFLVGVIAIGLAMLAKGPIGLVIPVFALGTHLLAHRKFKEIFHFRWVLAVILVAIIISPALIGLFKQFGVEGIKFFFWTNNVGRVTGSYRASNSDVTFYFHNLILMASPWFVFVYSGLILEIRKYVCKIVKKEKLQDSDELINIGGFILFFIILSIASQKNPHYLMAVLPLIMILSAKWVFQIFEGTAFPKFKKVVSIINHIAPILFWPLVLLFLLWFYPEKRIWFWALFILGSLGFVVSYFKMEGLKKQLTILLISQFVFFLSLNVSIMPAMFDYYSTFKACKMFNEQASDSSRLHSYQLRYWSIFYYSKNYGIWIREDDQLEKVVSQKDAWIFTDKSGIDALNAWKIKYNIRGEFNHRNITGQTFGFLNPKTRAGKFQKHYLVELDN